MPAPQQSFSQVSPRTVWTVGLNALVLVAIVLVLNDSRTVISWILVALLLALAIHPAVRWLTSKGLRRGLAVLAVFLVLGGLVALLVASLVPMLVEQGKALVEAAPDLLERIEESRAVKWADKRFDVFDRVQSELRENAAQAAAPALSVATGAARGLAATVTIVALTVFFLLFGDDVFRKALEWVRPEERERYVQLASRMHRVVGGYVAGSFLVASVGGVVTAVMLLGVSLAGVLGALLALPVAGALQVVLQDALARRQSRWTAGPDASSPQPSVATHGQES